MKYSNYTVEEFLQDDYFIRSVKHPTEEDRLFWQGEIGDDTSLRRSYVTAKSFIESVSVERKVVSDEDFVELWNRIESGNRAMNRRAGFSGAVPWIVSVAAACAIAIALAILFDAGPKTSVEADVVAAACALGTETGLDKVTLTLSNRKQIEIADNNAEIEYSSEGRIAVNTDHISDVVRTGKAEYNRLTVPFGKRSVLILSDGTKLWVNAGTTVVYPATFRESHREIYVDGEVFANVAHDSRKPFHVKSGMLDVIVMGTSFNVQSYKNESVNSVVLVEGSVRVEAGDDAVTLEPSEKLTIEADELSVTTVDTEDYVLWKDGVYKFNNEEFGVILKKLSKYYGVEIECDSRSSGLVCNGKIDLKEDINRVAKGLTTTVPVNLSVNEGRYTFKSNL